MIADLTTQKALDHYHHVGVAGLNEHEKTLAAIWCFESKVANGGFVHFFKSAEGDLAAYAPTAFRNVGAEGLAQIAARGNALLGVEPVPADKAGRLAAVNALPREAGEKFDALEREYADYDSDIDAQVEAYAAGGVHRPASS